MHTTFITQVALAIGFSSLAVALPRQPAQDGGIAARQGGATSQYGTVQGTTAPGAAPPREMIAGVQASVKPEQASYATKQMLVQAGATEKEIALAFLESSDSTPSPGSHYPTQYDGKTGDSANFTPFKINFFMIRTACAGFAGTSESQYASAASLNVDSVAGYEAALACLRATRAHPTFVADGGNDWFRAQRGGESALTQRAAVDRNPDVNWQNYKQGVAFCEAGMVGHLHDNVAVHYAVPHLGGYQA